MGTLFNVAFKVSLTRTVLFPTVDVDAATFRSPSPRILDIDDATQLVFLRDAVSLTIVAIARLDEEGKPVAWARVAAPKGARPIHATYKRIIGLEGGDGKIGCTICGHQGQQGMFPCYSCLFKACAVEFMHVDAPLREGDFCDAKMFQRYQQITSDPMTAPTTKKECDKRRDETYNISRRPIIDIPCRCRLYGGMHVVEGNYGKVDEFLVGELRNVDNKYGRLRSDAECLVEVLWRDRDCRLRKGRGEEIVPHIPPR